jgi:hypothetical protein
MSHVDEGALHAYLDGALDEYPAAEAERIREHLDGCAECAGRLEKERRTRSDATAMLGLAAPEVEMPSLEELRAYVKATRPRRPATAVRMYRLGWAASVVLAVGAGWMMRGGQFQRIQRTETGGFGGVAAPAAVPLDAESGGPVEAMGSLYSAPGPVVVSSDEARVADEGGAGAAGFGADAASADAGVPAAVAASAQADAEPMQNRIDLPLDVMAKATAAAEEEVVASRRRAAVDVGRDFDAMAAPAAASGIVMELPSARRAADSLLSGETAGLAAAAPDEPERVEGARAERLRAESVVPVTSAIDQGPGFAGSRAPAEDDFDAADEPSLVVPGYEVLSVTNMGEGTTPSGIHVVQRLDGDEILELFHLQQGVDPVIVPVPGDGRNEVREEVSGGWIIIQARLSEEELRALLASLFPQG